MDCLYVNYDLTKLIDSKPLSICSIFKGFDLYMDKRINYNKNVRQ
ncbi:MAG: hypothetical protein K0R06_2919 [Clostridium sp.]|jgi:hypothetical protein|nr:hypothetical protein [Clostridium sp.]